MRIGYLVNRYPAVSHSFIRREILSLERQGHEVLRISVRGWDELLQSEDDVNERERTRYVLRGGAIPLILALVRVCLNRPLSLVNGLKLTWKVSRRAERPLPIHLIYFLEACQVLLWVQNERIEHLHAHFGTNSAEVAMLVNEMGGPPWSFTPHGPEEFDKGNFIALPEKIRRADFVVGVSSFGRSQLFRYASHEHWKKVHVVHCGLETAFYEQATARAISKHRLICVGRLCEQKGQLLLLEATRILMERGTAMELVLAGDGEMRGELERLISRYKLEEVVRITGWISSEQVRHELLAARALVLPSFAEGLPVVIMEAMALRRPVISTFIAGIPELVEPGQHGWLVPAGDVTSLASAMKDCLDAPDAKITQMGEAAYVRVIERHSIDEQTNRLAQLFKGSIDQTL